MSRIFELYRAAATASGSGEPAEEVYLVMSGLTSSQNLADANGKYFLVDKKKTGTERIWKHETQEYYVRNVYSQWVLTDSATSTSYNVYIQDYNSNNYQAPWDEESDDSYVWYYQGSELPDVEFAPDIAGNSNFFYKEKTTSSDHSAVIPYDGVYVRQLQIPGTATPISYEDVGDSNPQMWIRHSPYDLDDVNKRSAVWKEDSAWKIGRLTLDASGAITSKEVRYSVPAGGEWPWKVFPAFADATLKIKKTKLTETPKIPQGLEVTAAPSDSSLVGKYTFRSIYGGHLFPQENDAFFEFDGTGKSFKVSKDYYGNLIWNLTGPEGYGYYQGDAEWFWPDAAKINMSYGGGAAEIEAIGTGTANIRILPQTSGTAPDFIEFGVYRRLESFIQNGYTIQFNYTSPAVPADAAPVNGVIRSGLKVWLKASEYDDFINNSLPSDGVSAFIIGSPKNNLNNENGIDFDPSGEADNDLAGQYGYETSCLYYGKVSRVAGGDGTLYIRLNKKAGKALSPQAFWPWEFGLYADENYKLNLVKTDLQADPPAPPVALYVSGFHERSNGYYANRVINNEYTPTANDRWRICGLDDSQFRQVDSVWYNGSKQRWEMYCWTGDSHQYAYSSATTEKWPDDADLLWYWGDRGYMSSNSLNDAGSIVGRSDEPISRYLTTKGLTLEDTSANYYFGQKLYSLRNSFNYEGRTPNLEDRFAIISTYDNAYRGSMEIRHDDSGYYWQIGKYVNNEYDSRLTKNVYCPPVATLEEMKWPWEIAEWACTHPGGGGGGVICAPLAFGVSDDDSITQAVGSYNSQTASGSAGYPGANSVWTCTTRDINVENLGTPTYYDRFISADGRAVIFLNADLGNINNGCRWVMRFPMYDDTGTAEDRYQRYNIAYQSASMDQRSPKWPWEVAWETPNTSYWPEPAPSFIKGSGATGGLYWGDRVFVKTKNSTDSYELPFLGGKQLPSVVNGTYAYSIYVDNQKVKIDSDFNGEFYLAPELLTWENFEGYDAAYKSRKTDKRQWYQPPDGGGSVEYGEDGAFGVILGKFNKAADIWTWLFGYFSYTAGGIDTKPHYERNGQSPVGSSWECTFIVDAANPEAVKVESVSGAVDQMAVAPNLVPKASDFWEGTVDGNAWSISWNSITKRYEAAVLGANFESNAIAVDESGNPKLFPWELTEEQWGAEFSAVAEIGIEGSRFEITGSDITGGYNENYKRDTPANGIYFSRKFGGKFANQSLAGANYDTYYIRRQTGTASNELRAQGALKFVTEHEGGPQWRLATNPNSDKYVFALAQRSGDWRTPYADYASLKPPYDFESAFFSWYGNGYFGKVVPWPGYIIANGQRDYKTIPMFGARFTTNIKIDGVVDEIVDFVYDDSLEPLGDAPTANSRWKGTRNGASTVAAADTEPTYLWSWDVDQKRWNLEITDENDYGSIDITSVSGDSAEPSLFPWEYKAYEFSGWSPGIVTGRMIESFTWQGSRIVINGVAQYSGNGGHDINGSYVSLYADPENYAYDSTNKNWCWFNKYGCRFGRWNNSSTGWALNSRDATFFSVYAANTDKLPWKDEDFSNDSSYNYGPSNFLVNGRPLDNPTGFTSAVDVIKCDADLKGRYVLVGYRTIVADGGFAELVYRKADNGSRLVWDGTKWVLYGPDQTDWYTASSSDQLRYPQDQTLTWEVGITGEGSNSNLPLIVAVPGETKLPKANRTVLTVAGAGTADANGTYNPVDGVDAFGSSMIWLKSDGTYKIWCNAISGAVANWLIGEANSIIGKYLLFDSPAADGAIEGPYTEDGSSKTWQVAAGGTAPAPTVTAVIAKDTIILSGASPEAINGEYELIDDTAEGDERIWSNGTYFVARGTSYTVWMVRSVDGRPSDPGSGNVYFYGSDTSKANPYNDDGTSYDWYSMYGSGTLSVAKG